MKINLQPKDFIDEILNLDASSLDEALTLDNLLVDEIIKREQDEEVTVEEVRDRQKKDNHNMSMIFFIIFY